MAHTSPPPFQNLKKSNPSSSFKGFHILTLVASPAWWGLSRKNQIENEIEEKYILFVLAHILVAAWNE